MWSLSHNLLSNLKQDQGKIVNKIWRGQQDIACEYVSSLYICPLQILLSLFSIIQWVSSLITGKKVREKKNQADIGAISSHKV